MLHNPFFFEVMKSGSRKMINSGTLYVVATPIGNLGDISSRACKVLQEVNLVLAEDTRTFRRLAAHLGINTPVTSYHEHNEQRRTPEIISRLKEGENIALVSDAGTPSISDPGYRLLHAAGRQSLCVRSVPGPCSLIAALSISGLPTNAFAFYGFLPHKEAKKKRLLAQTLKQGITTVYFESPYRILKTLAVLEELLPEAELFLARELTKLHEETLRGSPSELREVLSERSTVKGELVLIVGQSEKKHSSTQSDELSP